jgi:hypothetical protein
MSAIVVNTKKVTGRRKLRFENYEEVLTDVEQLAAGEVRSLGNWSFGQILKHLAVAVDSMIDGGPFNLPAPVKFIMNLLMKKRMLTRRLSPGFKLPKSAQALVPDETSVEEGIELLRVAIDRLHKETKRAPHGAFGVLSPVEWDQFQLRHCEMHLSFVVPANA